MVYDLPATSEPTLLIQLEARFAEALNHGCRLAQRVMEITGSINGKLGVLCTADTQYFGRIDISVPLIESPVPLEDYNARMKLQEQRAIISEFRRTFSGPLRVAMSNVSHALGGASIYFVYFEEAAIVIIPSRNEKDRWRLAALRLTGARSMDEERACVVANYASKHLHTVIWNMLYEHQQREIENDPSLARDVLDDPVPAAAPAATPPAVLQAEEDAIDWEDNDTDIDDEFGVEPAPEDPAANLTQFQIGRPSPTPPGVTDGDDPTDPGVPF